MARIALDLGVRDLARLAVVSPDTIARLERGEVLREKTVATIRVALERLGIIFLEDGEVTDGGPGVRLVRRQ